MWMEGVGMTEQEREELIEKMAKAAFESGGTMRWSYVRDESTIYNWIREARAALAIAEPVIREQCAKMAEKRACMIDCCEATGVKIAAAIREGWKEDELQRWRHVKTGCGYEVIGKCVIEATLKPAVLYRSIIQAPGKPVWARPVDDFYGGCFVKIDAAAAIRDSRNCVPEGGNDE